MRKLLMKWKSSDLTRLREVAMERGRMRVADYVDDELHQLPDGHEAEMAWVRASKEEAARAVENGEHITDYATASMFFLQAWAKAGDAVAAQEIINRRGF